MGELARVLALEPTALLQKVVESALWLCGAQAAGLCLLEEYAGQRIFRWRATAGDFTSFTDTVLPADHSPCGIVLERRTAVAMRQPARFYTYLSDLQESVSESLLVPLCARETVIGALWIASSATARVFDSEDLRIATALSHFASAALQAPAHHGDAPSLSSPPRDQAGVRTGGAESEGQSRSEQQFRFLESTFSSINDFAYLFDLEGRFQFVNRPLLELWGLTREEAIGKNFFELKYPDALAAKLQEQIQTVIRTKKALSDYTEYTSREGMVGFYHYIFTPVLDLTGTVEFVAGITRDVTDRKRIADRDRLLVALDDTTRPLTDPVEITQSYARLLGEHLNVNRCAYADVEEDEDTFNLTGNYNRDVPSIVGRYRFLQFGAECLRLMRAGLPYVVENSETDPRTVDVRDSYRATKICSVICVPLQKSGRFVAAMAVHQVTPRTWLPAEVELVQLVANRCWESIERTRVMRELAEARNRLEEHARVLELRVVERTAKLQETISELEAFSYSISHDLRGPLRVMRSFAQALQEDCGEQINAVGNDYIRRVVSAAERMDRIIQDVLVYSRIARTDLVLEPIKLDEFVPSLLEGYPQFHDESANITVVTPLPEVLGNKAALTQCFSNLIGNAVKFVAPGVFPQVRIFSEIQDDRARISIQDNGIGIEHSVRDKIFAAFYRLDQNYPGTGIGLAIVRKAVDRMGGQVGLSSEPGRGSTFFLDLALASKK